MKKFLFLLMLVAIFGSLTVNAVEDRKMSFDEVSVHDPSIIKDGEKYYVFGSHISTAESDDLINWKNISNGYARYNNTHFGDLSENLAGSFKWAGEDDSDCKGGFSVWAPDVYYNPEFVWENGDKGAYMMYYSASSTYKRSCIGLAVSRDVKGEYKYVDTVIYSGFTKLDGYDVNSDHNKNYVNTNIDDLIKIGKLEGYKDDWGIDDYNSRRYPNAIDPCVYEDKDGNLYLTYGSWSGGIFSLPVDKKTGLLIYPGKDAVTEDGRMVDRYFGTHISGGKGWSGEGAFIYYDEEADYFYLQVSYEWLGTDGGYHIRMFRSENPLGPFVDIQGNNAVYGDNHSEHGVKMFGNYYMRGINSPYTSPGHSSMLYDNGERFVFYHTRFKGTEHFQMRVHQMFMNEDGWPVVAPFRYMGDKLSEYGYKYEDVAGFYEYIDHGNAIGEGDRVTMTRTMELCKDGTIKGIVNGKWEMKGKYITIHYADEVLKGVVFRCNDEKGNDVMSFSVTGGKNRCLWGVKRYYVKNSFNLKAVAEYDFDGSIGENKVVCQNDGNNPRASENEPVFKDDALYLDGSYGIRLDEVDIKENMTVAFWVKSEVWDTYTPLLAGSMDFVEENQKWFSLTTMGGEDAFIWSRNAENNQWLEAKGKGSYKKNKWQHMTLVFEETSFGGSDMLCCRVYVDGFCVDAGYVAKASLEGDLYIGINPWDKPFKGHIDEMKVYNRAFNHYEAVNYYEGIKGER